MIWLWLAIGVLLVVWIVWPTEHRRPPILLLVRNRADEIEGVLRTLAASGAPVYAVVRSSGDESWAIARRVARTTSGVVACEGNVEDALDASGLAVALVVRLDDERPLRSVLQQAGF